MTLPERKPNRLKNYDYSSCGVYFITICTHDKACLFWDNATEATDCHPQLSEFGKIVNDSILNLNIIYQNVSVDKYVVMPNHIHILLRIKCDNGSAISTIIQQMKGTVTKKAGFSVWQKSFYDHVVRNQYDYNRIWQYIDTNPLKWDEDCFYK